MGTLYTTQNATVKPAATHLKVTQHKNVALFPGLHNHPVFDSAKWRGKAWEIMSCAMMWYNINGSHQTHMVGWKREGRALTKNLEVFLVIFSPRTRDQNIWEAVSIQFIVLYTWGWSMQSLWIIIVSTTHVCPFSVSLFSVYLASVHVARSPRPSSLFWHTISDQNWSLREGLRTKLMKLVLLLAPDNGCILWPLPFCRSFGYSLHSSV